MGTDITNWPVPYQIFAFIGAGIAGAVMWFLGARNKSPAPGGQQDLVAELRRQLDLAEQRASNAEQRLDGTELRLQIEEILSANREACFGAIAKLEDRVREAEQKIAVLESRRR